MFLFLPFRKLDANVLKNRYSYKFFFIFLLYFTLFFPFCTITQHKFYLLCLWYYRSLPLASQYLDGGLLSFWYGGKCFFYGKIAALSVF